MEMAAHPEDKCAANGPRRVLARKLRVDLKSAPSIVETGRLNMTTIANAACLARLLFYLEPVNCSTKTIHASQL
jgi:hypothetical protein